MQLHAHGMEYPCKDSSYPGQGLAAATRDTLHYYQSIQVCTSAAMNIVLCCAHVVPLKTSLAINNIDKSRFSRQSLQHTPLLTRGMAAHTVCLRLFVWPSGPDTLCDAGLCHVTQLTSWISHRSVQIAASCMNDSSVPPSKAHMLVPCTDSQPAQQQPAHPFMVLSQRCTGQNQRCTRQNWQQEQQQQQ